MTARRERLVVWMHGRAVATLSRQRDRLMLEYTADVQRDYEVNTPLISVGLPVQPGSYPHEKVRPFFEGLLPEGEARRMLAYDFRVAEDDVFGLLRALGRDCAGALVILPEGEPFPAQNPSRVQALTAAEVAQRLRQLDSEPLGVDQHVRISLAGVQHKLVLSRLPSGDWALPVGGLPSTHILKRANPRFAGMVANEAYCLAVARHLGLNVAEATIFQIPEDILVVTRYDRTQGPQGTITRIHQEDLAQALRLPSSAKYEERGGPSLRRVAQLLREATGSSESLERLLDITFLNLVVGNADAHAKNFSLLHLQPGVVRLAPAYDIMSTSWYPQADRRLAMAVHGKTSVLEVGIADLVTEAVSWRLHRGRVLTRVTRLLDLLPTTLAAAAHEVPSAPSGLLAHIRERAERLIVSTPISDH